MSTRIYYGDLRLWGVPNAPTPVPGRTVTQEFQGSEQDRALVWASSPNSALDLECTAVAAMDSAKPTRLGLLALKRQLWTEYVSRAAREDPVIYVDDDSTAKTASGFSGGAIQCTGHGFVDGDVVLCRRAGAGNYILGTVGSASDNAFVLTPVTGTIAGIVPQAADDLLLVSAYWCGMVWLAVDASDQGWHFDASYAFRGAPDSDETYARTA